MLTTLGVCLSLSAAGVSTAALADASARSASHLTEVADAMTVRVGTQILITGNATPASTAPVYLQRWVAGHWRTLAHKTPHAAGAYTFSVKAAGTPRTWIF